MESRKVYTYTDGVICRPRAHRFPEGSASTVGREDNTKRGKCLFARLIVARIRDTYNLDTESINFHPPPAPPHLPHHLLQRCHIDTWLIYSTEATTPSIHFKPINQNQWYPDNDNVCLKEMNKTRQTYYLMSYTTVGDEHRMLKLIDLSYTFDFNPSLDFHVANTKNILYSMQEGVPIGALSFNMRQLTPTSGSILSLNNKRWF